MNCFVNYAFIILFYLFVTLILFLKLFTKRSLTTLFLKNIFLIFYRYFSSLIFLEFNFECLFPILSLNKSEDEKIKQKKLAQDKR